MKRAMVMVCAVLFCTGMVLASGPTPAGLTSAEAQASANAVNTPSAKAVPAVEQSRISVTALDQAPAVKPAAVPVKHKVLEGARQGGDTCATATVIGALPYSDIGTTIGYANDYDAVCPYTGSTAPDVAYVFEPAEDLLVDLTLCIDISDYDTKLYVFADQCITGTHVACNDDSCHSPYYSSNYQSQILDVVMYAGTTYYIIVDGYSAYSGNYQLDVTGEPFGGGPENDNCQDAIPVTVVPGTPVTVYGDNTGCTVDCSALGGGPEVWYVVTTYETMNLSVAYCGTSPAFGNAYIVFDTVCPCSGTWVFASEWNQTDCGDGNWTLIWNGLPAGTYYWPVLTESGSSGPFTVTFDAYVPPPPPPGLDCPPVDTMFGQPSPDANNWMSASTSASQFPYWVFDDYTVDEPIADIHWWGLSGLWNGGWYMCDPAGMTFQIRFYADVAGYPDFANPVCTYNVTPTIADSFPGYGSWTNYRFEVPQLIPCCLLTSGWVSIQSTGSTNGCVFLWMASASGGNGWQYNGSAWTATGYNFAMCLTRGECEDVYGACCLDYEQLPICGDLNNDFCLFEEDFWAFVDAFGTCVGDPKYNAAADFDGDECITLVDYQAWLACWFQYGNTCGGYGLCIDDVEALECIGMGGRFVMDTLCADLDPPCGELIGACCNYGGLGICEYTTWYVCTGPDMIWLGPNSSCNSCPCYVQCEPDEGEPICGNEYDDTYNGGCNSSPPIFQPIACDQTICGTSGTFLFGGSSYRDTDWFEITTTGYSDLYWTVEAEFPLQIFVIKGAGPGDCSSYTIVGSLSGGECEQITLDTYENEPGTYWFWVGPSVFTGVPCGARYQATLTCVPVEIRGACCDDSIPYCEENVLFENCTGRFARDTACDDMMPPCGGCPEDTLLVEILLDTYPGETTWDVKDLGGNIVCSGGPYTTPSTLVYGVCCLDADECYIFTIYDSYGDGIYSPGYWVIYLNDEFVAEGGGSFYQQSSEPFGGGCGSLEGRCCYGDPVMCADVTQDACDVLGGTWTYGLNCTDNPCPTGCTHTLEAWDDYGDGWNGGTVDVYVNGELRLDNYTLASGAGPGYAYFLADDGDTIQTVFTCGSWCYECSYYIYDGLGQVIGSDGLGGVNPVGITTVGNCSGTLVGRCCLDPWPACQDLAYGDCIDLGGDFAAGLNCIDNPCPEPCDPYCEPNEGEPDCYDEYVDVTNGGCNSDGYPFGAIACGETICGTSGTYLFGGSSYRDTDWFEFTLTETTDVSFCGCGTFGMYLFILQVACPNATVLASVNVPAGGEGCANYTLGAGTWAVWVGPDAFSGVPCGSTYKVTLNCTPALRSADPVKAIQADLGNKAPSMSKKPSISSAPSRLSR